MATKRSGQGSPVAKGAPADFVSWKARASIKILLDFFGPANP
jgi:hypothetical protein